MIGVQTPKNGQVPGREDRQTAPGWFCGRSFYFDGPGDSLSDRRAKFLVFGSQLPGGSGKAT